MPSNLVKTDKEEKLWNKAKSLAEEQGHKEDWPYIVGIFKRMNPKRFKKALEFPSEKALDDYLKEHPGAKRQDHTVKLPKKDMGSKPRQLHDKAKKKFKSLNKYLKDYGGLGKHEGLNKAHQTAVSAVQKALSAMETAQTPPKKEIENAINQVKKLGDTLDKVQKNKEVNITDAGAVDILESVAKNLSKVPESWGDETWVGKAKKWFGKKSSYTMAVKVANRYLKD